MGTSFGVVIPMVDARLTDNVLTSIMVNSVQPHRIVIIDNSDSGDYNPRPLANRRKHVRIDILPQKGLGVNASWRAGMAAIADKVDLLTFLNDDVLLGPRFFEKLVGPFQIIDCGCVCPLTYTDPTEFENNVRLADDDFDLEPLKRREGWAFTFKSDLLRSLPPIPEELVTFCGDDWLFHFTKARGFKWYRDHSNMIFHAIGATLRKRPEIRTTMEVEKEALVRLVAAYHAAHDNRREGN